MKALLTLITIGVILSFASFSHAQSTYFNIRPISDSEFYTFVKVFSEMRGPLRSEILKDKETNFESADPLKYVAKVKDDKDVKKVLKERNLNWDQFSELMGNILLGYFSIQPEKTKASLLRQLASYGLMMSNEQIPAEYRQLVTDVLKTDEGAALAGMALETFLKIPPENIELARKNKRQLDQLFYTRFWKDKI